MPRPNRPHDAAGHAAYHLHYREFVKNGRTLQAICSVCNVHWPCRFAIRQFKQARSVADPWWFVGRPIPS